VQHELGPSDTHESADASAGDRKSASRKVEAFVARLRDAERNAFLDYLDAGAPLGETQEAFARWLRGDTGEADDAL
jgi:hypothetical protein